MDTGEKVVLLADHKRGLRTATVENPECTVLVHNQECLLREAQEKDIPAIQELYRVTYQGTYSFEYAVNPAILRAEMSDGQHHLWLVAETRLTATVVGAIMFTVDPSNRLAKAAGAVVMPAFRGGGLGSSLLETGVAHLTRIRSVVDVIYATTRTINVAPSRMVKDVGFHPMGVFPNAVQMENWEHLNLDVFLTETALTHRRKKPYLFPPFQDVYSIARQQLGLEKANPVTERAPLRLSAKKLAFRTVDDEGEAVRRFRELETQQRLSNHFFPLHRPNRILVTEDGGTEVFLCFGGVGKQSAILGYRTDQVNLHDLLDSVALALQRAGAGYVELLVDAYNYMLQQAAFTARFIPSAYFPAMRLNDDGLRDDFFVLSRTFHLLDFTGMVMPGENLKFLRAYLRYYHELYIQPILK